LKKLKSTVLLFLFIFVFIGCAHYPTNAKLDNFDKEKGYRFRNLLSEENSNSLFVILAFSGGGTRAAAFSYGVMEKLRDTEIMWEGKKRHLLDEVDIISSVSGGSFTSAYYALYRDKIFTDFESQFLKIDIEGALEKELFSPLNWFRLASPAFDRIDMAAEYYDGRIFNHYSFKDLPKKKPFILINATDMTLGARFEFTQDQFDLLCSDLSEFPISRAVAASSAFPVLLSPVTVKNYAGSCNFSEAGWVNNAMNDRNIAASRFARAMQVRSYLDKDRRPFIHLMDGGVADNIGLREPMYSMFSTDSPWSVLRMVDMEQVKKIVVIVVNAKTEPNITLDQKESAPGLKDTLMTVANAPMDNYSFETIELLKKNISQWQKDVDARKSCETEMKKSCPQAELAGGHLYEIDFYPIVIGFDAIQDPAERSFFKNLPTSFSLPPETVNKLRNIAGRLLDESAAFQKLKGDLK
jgi:NTE family protein